jgi:hypothetical protein
MAATPLRVPIESRAIGHDAETLRFQRLERVRAQRRARRYRLSVAATLAIALAGAGVLGLTTIRRLWLEQLGSPSSPTPVEMVKPAAASPATSGSVFQPSAVTPRSTGADAVTPHVTQPPPSRVDAEQQARPLAASQARRVVAPSRNEPHDAAAADPTAAIDWLLKTSRTRSADGREEKLQ